MSQQHEELAPAVLQLASASETALTSTREASAGARPSIEAAQLPNEYRPVISEFTLQSCSWAVATAQP